MLAGDSALSISDVEAEESWRIVEPILAAWAAGEVPFQEYPAGLGRAGALTGSASPRVSAFSSPMARQR